MLLILAEFEMEVLEHLDEEGRKVFCCPSCPYKSLHGRGDIKKHMEVRHSAQQLHCICPLVAKSVKMFSLCGNTSKGTIERL